MNKRLLVALVLGSAFIGSVSSAPFITVTEQRLIDQRIQATVMDVLSRSSDLSGHVVVESQNQVVTLSGHLATNSQIRSAGRSASHVDGVRFVVNEIRPRLGAVGN
jgi:osmotically-inducible protein OsmY